MLESTEQFSGMTVMWQWVPDWGSADAESLADNESAIRGTESNSLSADRSVLSGW